MSDLTASQIGLVKKILRDNLPQGKVVVWVFGSRAHGRPGRGSDLDLMIKSAVVLPLAQIAVLKEAFENSNLPFAVDVVDYHRVNEKDRESLLAGAKELGLGTT